MTQFKKNLLDGEREQQAQMVARWRQVESNLHDPIELLARRVQEAGLTPSQLQSSQFQLDRYRSLMAQVTTELDRYTDYAAPLIEQQQRVYAQQGIQHASQAITAVGVDNGVTIRFDVLPVSATENMIGLAGDGSPLRDLLQDSYGSAADGMLNELVRATATGQNPRVTADRMVRNGLSQSLTRMMATARTESLRVYRESSRQTYQHSKVINGYMRIATRDNRVCAACMMDDGQRYAVNEVMAEHVQGRCAMVPIVAGYKPAEWERGPQWFLSQSATDQQAILGKGRFDAWQAGKFELDKLVTVKSDGTWGDSLQVTPLRDLV